MTEKITTYINIGYRCGRQKYIIGGSMVNLKVRGVQNILNHEILVVEGGFGDNQRVILAKTIAEIHNMSVTDVNKLINNNLENFVENVDWMDILETVSADKSLRDSLNLTLREVNKNTKHIYVLSRRGYIRLVAAMRNNNVTKWDVMDNYIDEYFEIKSNLHEVAGKFLSAIEVNKILKLVDKNQFVNEYTKILVPPRGNKGKAFKVKEIGQFIGKMHKEAGEFLISYLGVPDLEHIPSFTHKYACIIVEELYTPSDKLRKEFNELLNKLLDLREEVIAENRAKNIEQTRLKDGELRKVREAVKELFSNVYNDYLR